MKRVLVLAVLLICGTAQGGSYVGFRHAQWDQRRPISVQNVSDDAQARGMRYWNRLAGWNLFEFYDPTVHPGGSPEVFFHELPNCPTRTCALPQGTDETYTACQIWVDFIPEPKSYRKTWTHELGHCLGFDHQTKGIMSLDYKKDKTFDQALLRGLGY